MYVMLKRDHQFEEVEYLWYKLLKVFLVGKARYCGKCIGITTKNTTDKRQINCKFKDMHDSWSWLALGGHNCENFCPFGVTEDAMVPLGLKNAQECDYVSSPFCIDKLRIWPKLLTFVDKINCYPNFWICGFFVLVVLN